MSQPSHVQQSRDGDPDYVSNTWPVHQSLSAGWLLYDKAKMRKMIRLDVLTKSEETKFIMATAMRLP